MLTLSTAQTNAQTAIAPSGGDERGSGRITYLSHPDAANARQTVRFYCDVAYRGDRLLCDVLIPLLNSPCKPRLVEAIAHHLPTAYLVDFWMPEPDDKAPF